MSIIIFFVCLLPLIFGQEYANNPRFSADRFEQTEHSKIPVKSYAYESPNLSHYFRNSPKIWMGRKVFYDTNSHPFVSIDQFQPGKYNYIFF